MRSVLIVALALAALTVTSASGAVASRCAGAQLAGRFTVVRGSAGAGSISYELGLKNVSARACTLTGLPVGQLLGRRGGKLPTHISAARPGALTALLVTLRPGQSAHATARFSPDVPGPGEGHIGACEPTSYTLRVSAPGGGVVNAKLAPPTPVCGHGSLRFTGYGR